MLIEDLMKQVDDGSIQAQARPASPDSVFLSRIKEFEGAYAMRWFEFMEKYDQHELSTVADEKRIDFAEWYMLCQRFSEQLEEGITIMASPPPTHCSVSDEEGPSNRAFTFARLKTPCRYISVWPIDKDCSLMRRRISRQQNESFTPAAM